MIIEIFLASYLFLVIVLALISLATINDKLKKMGNVKIFLFLLSQPFLIIREILSK